MVKTMNEIMMGMYTRTTKSNEQETCNFNFKTNLSIADKLKFVNSVVDLVVTDDNYNSIIRDLIFDYYIIDIFTDIDTSDIKEINFLNNAEQFLLETNIIEIIEANAFPTLFRELNDAVDKSIEYRTGIHHNPLNDALASLISTLEKKVNEVDLESMMGMAQKFAGMGDDFTMENLVKAYMESDIHKKNLAEIEEAKKQRAEFAEDMDKAINGVAGK